MRLISIIVIAVVGLAAGEARAQEYRARCDALTASIRDLPGVPQADKDRMTAAVAEYCGRRSACLASVRSAMQAKAAKLDGTWPDCVNRPPLDAIDKGLAALSPEVAFKPPALPLYSIGPQEAAFFQALNGALKSLAIARDDVFTGMGDVTTYTAKVRDYEWPAVQRSSAQFCREVTDAANQTSMYFEVTQKVEEASKKANQKLVGVVKAAALVGLAQLLNIDPDDLRTILEGTKEAATRAALARAQSQARAAVERAISGMSGTMQLYIVLREYVRVFLGSYKNREARINDGNAALDKFAAAAAAPGQDVDAKALVAVLKPELSALSGEYVKAYDELDRLHNEQIVRLRDQIACTDAWNRLQGRISGDQRGADLAGARRMLMDALSYNYGAYQQDFDRRVAPELRAADAALEVETRARAEDQRAVDEGVRKSRQ